VSDLGWEIVTLRAGEEDAVVDVVEGMVVDERGWREGSSQYCRSEWWK